MKKKVNIFFILFVVTILAAATNFFIGALKIKEKFSKVKNVTIVDSNSYMENVTIEHWENYKRKEVLIFKKIDIREE